ncbi:protein DOG1-like 3 [Nymphaea colorata]|uniref:protein DOG1-like 3 n=1 Tax=Nymphaea colorata TaxID=210225 RepID=UPI00129DC45C|nr:protein DOG1-like 3 [Nymphaea colorata]
MADNQQGQDTQRDVQQQDEATRREQQQQHQQHQQHQPRCSFRECFLARMDQHRSDLEDLVRVRSHQSDDEQAIRRAITSAMQHYLDYNRTRASVARRDAPAICSPVCSSSFNNSYLWLGGCRPSLIIRLVYVMAGQAVEAQLWNLLGNVEIRDLAGLSAHQLQRLSDLQSAVIKLEDGLSKGMATLQESMADRPLVSLARAMHASSSSSENQAVGQMAGEMNSVMEMYARRLAGLIEDADKLRLYTLAKTVEILTIKETLDLLIAAAQLHVYVLEQGQRWDRSHAT